MTTTSTFQGMNTDSKPSSRVLKPPGGSSSNIFGYDDAPPQQQTQVRNRDNVNKGNNDIFNQGPTAAGSVPQKTRVPRSGDDSFHNLFGIDQTAGLKHAHSKSKPTTPFTKALSDETSGRNLLRQQHKNSDSFSNVFGEASVNHRNMFRRIRNPNDDSFSRLFGQSSFNESSRNCEYTTSNATNDSAVKIQSTHSVIRTGDISPCASASTTSLASTTISQSSPFRESPREDEDIASSFNRVFGQYMADQKPSRSRRFSDRGAYNPITGELYDQPKQEMKAPASSIANSATSKEVAVGSSPPDSDPSSSTKTVTEAKSDYAVEQSVQPATPQTAATLQTTTVPQSGASAPKPQQRQQGGSGIFGGGGAEDVKEQRSTRVSQPPGGRSTKLW